MIITDDGRAIGLNIQHQTIANITHDRVKGEWKGIVVHQTGGSTIKSALDWWTTNAKRTGAHFLVGADGLTIQTVSLNNVAHHIGKPLIATRHNENCIGIEFVGACFDKFGNINTKTCVYQDLTSEQQEAGNRLIFALRMKYNIMPHEVYKHPHLSQKHWSEAKSYKHAWTFQGAEAEKPLDAITRPVTCKKEDAK